MIIELDMTKDTPIYEQLKQQIVAGIARGKLQPGEPMPSVRQLAADLSINLHTVAKAYGQLKDEGVSHGAPKPGRHRQPGAEISGQRGVYRRAHRGAGNAGTRGAQPRRRQGKVAEAVWESI